MKKVSFVIKLIRPYCRTPIKPKQPNKIEVKYSHKSKHKAKNEL
jgi:hypothetical protein